MGTFAQSDVGSHPSTNKPVNYQYVFATPFPKQYQVADSIFFELAKTDTVIASRAIDDMHTAVMQSGDELTQLNFGRCTYQILGKCSIITPGMFLPLQATLTARFANTLLEISGSKMHIIAALVHATLGRTLNMIKHIDTVMHVHDIPESLQPI